jgi:hypothetical protein
MSQERHRTSVLWNALNEATDLLCYYVTAHARSPEASFHAIKIEMFDRIMWGERKNMPPQDKSVRKHLEEALKEGMSKKGLLDDPRR